MIKGENKYGTKKEKRHPDSDLVSAFKNGGSDKCKLEDIDDILAEIAGENDEYAWFWIVSLKDRRYAMIEASCDYTGWDCQSSLDVYPAYSIKKALEYAPEKDRVGRTIRKQLERQISGEQPFGLYDGSIKSIV